ncbi:unnamed protein product [Adineta ricciae]|uniref:UDENN domain-containing protein n=1 Tax=Adineta ricciae TaxID=249248 RepID=A0A815I9N7_ADIRI|nr:unnamed protein product [Adineta ricciae]
MTSIRSEYLLKNSISLDYGTKLNSLQDDDTKSHSSLNIESSNGLHYLSSPPLHGHSSQRQSSNKNLSNSIIQHRNSHENGFTVNGSFFDEQIFQPARSSYVTDYVNTPHDCNRFLEGHHLAFTSSSSSNLDAHLYKLAFIITLSDQCVDKELLLGHYPPDDDNHEDKILEALSVYKRFCFPELNSNHRNGGQLITDSATYIFTRTLSNGQVEYGYCRRLSKEYNQMAEYPIVICIVSSHSYFKLYDAILNELIKAYMTNEMECSLLMQAFYSKPLPMPNLNSSGVTCVLNDRRLFFYVCPRDDRLNHDYFSTLLSCLSSYQIIYLFESMLRSKRILLFSHYPSKLTKCTLALSLLIYPFIWPYSFVSLMPSSWLTDLLDSPCPYIYGCLRDTMQQIPKAPDSETLIVDLDLCTLDGNLETTYLLPYNLRQILESSLDYVARFRLLRTNSILTNIAVSEAFLSVFTELLYRLPDFFKRNKSSITEKDQQSSIGPDRLQHRDSGIDLQSLVSMELSQVILNNEPKAVDNYLGYEFHTDEFLRVQITPSYVIFLKEFISGMLFMKFLDDYQRNSENTFSLFIRRLNERRQRSNEDLTINPLIRFRQTFDLLEKQMKLSTKPTNPSFSKFLRKIFE